MLNKVNRNKGQPLKDMFLSHILIHRTVIIIFFTFKVSKDSKARTLNQNVLQLARLVITAG